MSLKEKLKRENLALYSKYEGIVSLSKSEMPKTKIFFPTFTNHDIIHLEDVESLVGEITKDIVDYLSDEEIFCLLSAIWLHDIGMIPKNHDEIVEYNSKNIEEKELFRIEIRKKHHIRSKLYVERHKDVFNLNELEAKAIGNICKGHRQVNLSEFSDVYISSNIRISSLAAILRIADECDVSESRESVLSGVVMDEKTRFDHHRKHQLIKKVDFNNNEIKIISYVYKDEDKQIILDTCNDIKNELKEANLFLQAIGIIINDVSLRITFDRDLIINKIILCIVNEVNLERLNEFISQNDIDDALEFLYNEKFLISNEDKLMINSDINIFKQIFKRFLGKNLEDFFFTKYVQEMVDDCFKEIGDMFNIDFRDNVDDRKIILKNSPTAFYLLLFIDEIIDNSKFNINSSSNGILMFDSLLSFGLFNDIHQYSKRIEFDEIMDVIPNFKFFDNEYYLSRIMGCKVLGGLENE